MNQKVKIGILGASSYTGRELVKILLSHSAADISWLHANSNPGSLYTRMYPQFKGFIPEALDVLLSESQVLETAPDVVFSCLPHGASASLLKSFISNKKTKVIDLSADFRLKDLDVYENVYGVKHPIPDVLENACYGLCEWHGGKVKSANVIGNPGCYPTSILLPLLPLIKENLIDTNNIIADSKSGISGAGKGISETTHFGNRNEAFEAYKIGDQHRHISEISEQLTLMAKAKINLLFTPHLVPMERGILSTIYCSLSKNVSQGDLDKLYQSAYGQSKFVHHVDVSPSTRDVSGTNHCHFYTYLPRAGGQLIIVSVIDNLIKGASGQAVQNMNLMFGLDESTGLL